MPAVAAFAVYVLVTALLFRDLLPHLGTHFYSDLGDPVLNAAILYWNTHHLPLTTEWWNFPSFAPLSGVTAFTEHLLLAYPLTTPVILATDNPILAHNLVLLLSFPLNGIAAYFLARHLTGSKVGGFIGGLAFAFAPYQSVQLSHIQSLAVFGMPIAMLGLHQRRWWLFGFGWLCTALANAYTLVFFPVLVVVWCIWFIHPSEWRKLIPIAVTTVLFSLPLVPLLWGYQVRQGAYGFARHIGEMRDFGADINAVIGISQREQLWRWLLPHTFEESALFPGITITALALIAFVKVRGTKYEVRGTWSTRLLITAGVLTGIVLARLWMGPFGWHLGPIPLPPFQPFRVFTVAVAIGVGSLAVNQRLHAAWRRRDPIVFYAVAILVLWFLAIGPQPEWSASHFRALTYGPYYALIEVPGFSSVRVPARAWLQAVLCLAMLAAWGAAYLADRKGPPRGATITVLAIAIVAEGWFVDHVVAAPPRMVTGVIPRNAITLDLPIDEGFWNTIPEYQAVLGGYRTINGYSGYEPPHFNPLRHRIADAQADALNPFRVLGDVYVIIHAREFPERAQWILDHPGAQIIYRDREQRIVRLPAMSSPPRPPVPIPLPRRGARPFGT